MEAIIVIVVTVGLILFAGLYFLDQDLREIVKELKKLQK